VNKTIQDLPWAEVLVENEDRVVEEVVEVEVQELQRVQQVLQLLLMVWGLGFGAGSLGFGTWGLGFGNCRA